LASVEKLGVGSLNVDTPNVPSPVSGTGSNIAPGGSSTEAIKPAVVVAQLDSQWISTSILSLGIVAALIVFVIESFTHPNAATILVPLIMAPLGSLILRFVHQKKTIDCPKCGTHILASGSGESE
jgi:hypothetical protein